MISPLVDEYDVHKINQICADTSKHKESVKNLLLETLDKETLLLKQDYEDKDTVFGKKIHTEFFMRNGYVSEGFFGIYERKRTHGTYGNGKWFSNTAWDFKVCEKGKDPRNDIEKTNCMG